MTAAELPVHETFFVAGANCLLATNSPDIVNSISELHPSTKKSSPRSFEMNVFVNSSIAGDRQAAPHFRGSNHLVFAAFGDQEMFAFDLQRNTGFGVVSAERAQDRHFWNQLLLPIAVGVLGATMGIVPFHAACLDRSGKALMLVGPSGSGKSTLAVALTQHGFSLISDDWTYVTRKGAKLNAYGLRAPVKLLPDAVNHFGALRSLRPARSLNGEMAYEVDAQDVFGSHVQFQSEPARLLFLERVAAAGCDLIPYSRDDAREFFESSAERLPAEFASAMAGRSQIIDELTRLNCWLLRTGDSPDDTAHAVSRFCEGL